MDKYENALNEIKTSDELNECGGGLFKEEFNLLQELVGRAKPKKPIRKEYVLCCPNCKEFDDSIEIEIYSGGDHYNKQLDYCNFCGQAIDWSKDGE